MPEWFVATVFSLLIVYVIFSFWGIYQVLDAVRRIERKLDEVGG
jgi:hypothetical protein